MITGKQLYEIVTGHVYMPQKWTTLHAMAQRMWEIKAKHVNHLFVKEPVDEQTDDGQGFPQESP